MTPFGNGTPERRRPGDHPRVGGKREDDPELEVAKSWSFWAKLLVFHRGKLSALAMALAGVAGYTVAAYGLGRRVDKVEATTSETKKEVSTLSARTERLERNDEIKTFMLCALMAQSGSALFPRECGPIIDKRIKQP